jgi:cytochrome c oxidase subunit IV
MAATHVPDVQVVDDDLDAHPSRIRLYVGIAVFLAVLTGIEVATYYVPDIFGGKASTPLIALLMILMAVKFWTVAWFFMHLKFDKRLLTSIFYMGLGLAVLVYLAILAMFRFFGPTDSHMIKR